MTSVFIVVSVVTFHKHVTTTTNKYRAAIKMTIQADNFRGGEVSPYVNFAKYE